MAEIRPLGNLVVVECERLRAEGAIELPSTTTSIRSMTGLVLATGPGRRTEGGALRPIYGVKAGDRVLLRDYHRRDLGDGRVAVVSEFLDAVLLDNQQLKALNDRIIVTDVLPYVESGEVEVAFNASQTLYYGNVSEVSDDPFQMQPIAVKVGDVVMFRKYSALTFNHSGRQFMVIRQPDVLGVMEPVL